MIKDLKQMAGATPIITEWFGEGMEPVSRELALRRAKICTSFHHYAPCEHNVEPNWWHRHLADPIAQAIITLLEFKKNTDIHLPVYIEGDLFMCRRCGCNLSLKVWTPIKHIANHTTVEQLAKYPSFCWIRQEIINQETL
jgi:hypothetical protein